MKAIKKNKTLEVISKINSLTEKSQLENDLFNTLDEELIYLSDFLKINKHQAFLVAIIFSLNLVDRRVDLEYMSRYITCKPIDLLPFQKELEALESMGFIIIRKQTNRYDNELVFYYYTVHMDVTKAILTDQVMDNERLRKKMDILEVLENIRSSYKQNNDSSTMEYLIKKYSNFPFFIDLEKHGFDYEEQIAFVFITWEIAIYNEDFLVFNLLEKMYENELDKICFLQMIVKEQSKLTKSGFVETIGTNQISDLKLRFTDDGISFLESHGLKLTLSNSISKLLIEPSQIQQRALYFSGKLQSQIEKITSLLAESNFVNVKNRLKENNQNCGISILMHGLSGTGKTEAVLQIAKQTGRSIFKIDMTKIRSMWYGETEKNIKTIFRDYEKVSRSNELMPILFFNEADAIISSRIVGSNDSISNIENVNQNILLDELENFQGIFFATTNLMDNIDTAFDRRFLFKVLFNSPEVESKRLIWKEKLPDLLDEDLELLLKKFDFTGGQIDNISRKVLIDKIIFDLKPDIFTLERYCYEEFRNGGLHNKIGFIA